MRIITGLARGRKLKEPKDDGIRPTSDMVKEALFNIVQFDIEGRRVLDLFTGTGQLGIEALSRGAASAVLVDMSREASALASENLKRSELSGGEVITGESLAFLEKCGKNEFGLIFIDPPYDGSLCKKALEKIASRDLLAPGGRAVCETTKDALLPELSAPYTKGREYVYGKIKLTVYERE